MKTRPIEPRRLAAGIAAFCMAAGGFAVAFADTIIPDPPVPAEMLAMADMGTSNARVTAPARAGTSEPDCNCGALHARDLESRVEGHVEHWEAMPHAWSVAQPHPRLKVRNVVEGVVGFPVRHYRLAQDSDGATVKN